MSQDGIRAPTGVGLDIFLQQPILGSKYRSYVSGNSYKPSELFIYLIQISLHYLPQYLSLFCTSEQLDESKNIVIRYRNGEDLPHLSEDKIWEAKHIYDSAFHPDTGEKMFLLGRMSAQVPMNMMITAAMLTFYKTPRQVIFWQWFNQSFNAVVNYTNRSGSSPISLDQLGISYLSATSAALVTALSLNKLVKRAPPLIGRFVPFVAVAAANCINIPLMRQKEIKEGIEVYDSDGQKIGQSKVAAKKAIQEVVMSRIAMASPGMGRCHECNRLILIGS